MICPICFGHRLFYFDGQLLPCPECEGFGAIHCCDGLQAQPEEDTSSRKGDLVKAEEMEVAQSWR